MGGRNEARLTDRGVENKYWFRDRVLRDHRYKLYVGTDRLPQKFFDLTHDPTESNNLLGKLDKTAQKSLNAMMKVVETMPKRDSDPRYTPLPHRPWYKTPKTKSEVWKTGLPWVQ